MNDLKIKVTNITPVQRKVYRILRTSMGLQRQEAKICMLGYLLGEETAKTVHYQYIDITDQILSITADHSNPKLADLRHEWEHMRENLKISIPKYKASVNRPHAA